MVPPDARSRLCPCGHPPKHRRLPLRCPHFTPSINRPRPRPLLISFHRSPLSPTNTLLVPLSPSLQTGLLRPSTAQTWIPGGLKRLTEACTRLDSSDEPRAPAAFLHGVFSGWNLFWSCAASAEDQGYFVEGGMQLTLELSSEVVSVYIYFFLSFYFSYFFFFVFFVHTSRRISSLDLKRSVSGSLVFCAPPTLEISRSLNEPFFGL